MRSRRRKAVWYKYSYRFVVGKAAGELHGRVEEAAAATAAAAVVGVVVVVDARASKRCSVSMCALQERSRTSVRRIEEHENKWRGKRPVKEG